MEKFETIERAARNIQNTLKLWPSSDYYKALREDNQLCFHQIFAQQRKSGPEIRIYLDETGTHKNSGLLAVAGICIIDWRQYEIYHAALSQWRSKLGHPETLHAKDISNDITHYKKLLDQLDKHKGGLLFVAHVIEERAFTHIALESLFFQIVIDTIRKLGESGCLIESKALTVFKEADDGFDKMYLGKLRNEIEGALASEFPDLVYLKDILPIPKGREILLEASDLIAHSIQRRKIRGKDPKDILAEGAMNVTGLEDPRDNGIVFKKWQFT